MTKFQIQRRERDSNPRYTFGVYTLSRRASSTTRASLLSKNSINTKKTLPFSFHDIGGVALHKNKKAAQKLLFSGETGIRTPGTSRYNGFQDRRNRPLCHLSKTSLSEVLFVKSGAKVRIYFKLTRVFTKKNHEHHFQRIAISRYFMLKSIKYSIFMLII